MSLLDVQHIPGNLRTYAQILADYRDHSPLFDAYQDVIEEHSHPDNANINEPYGIDNGGDGIDTLAAAARALERIGRPARDRDDVLYAAAHIQQMTAEIDRMVRREKTISDLVLDGLYPFAGCMPTARDWSAQPDDEKAGDVDEILRLAPDHTDKLKALLRQALGYAMPAILREITANDQKRRADRAGKGGDQ